MGHAYGFNHGRNTRPDSWDLVGECVPGGYGDRFDVMSWDTSAKWLPKPRDPDERLGVAGPNLPAHQLKSQELLRQGEIHSIVGPTAQPVTVSLRPPTRRDLAGAAALAIGDLLVEFRHKGRRVNGVFSTDGWDQALPVGDSPGCVLVYDTAPPSPAVLCGTSGNEGLVVGDRFESRLGLGDVSLSVRSIDESGERADVEVEVTQVRVNPWHRWLVLPCQYPDLAAPTAKVAEIADMFIGGVEAFWRAMSDGTAPSGGAFVVSALGSTGDKWIPLTTTWATDAARDPATRVRRSVEEALALKNPTNSMTPFYLDWRYFTGIILLRNTALGMGWVGELSLPSGNALSKLPDCGKETATGSSAGPLAYRVIEIGADALNQAGLARAIGRSLGLGSGDEFDLMGTDPGTHRYTATSTSSGIGKTSWGAIGPGLSSDNLAQLGWLRNDRSFLATVPQGQRHTTGRVTLVPLTKAQDLPGYVRLLLGPYSLEVRTNDGWDSGLPDRVVVLARSFKGVEVRRQSESISNAGPLADITGSVSATIDSLTDQAAIISYRVHEGVEIVAGGGTLHGGGTILFTSDGRVVRIPPGDPFERQARAAFSAVSAFVKRIEGGEPLRRLRGEPESLRRPRA